MIDNVKLAVKIRNKIGDSFSTNICTPQGYCISAILFKLYLANALTGRHLRSPKEIGEHNNVVTEIQKLINTTNSYIINTPTHLNDQNYNKRKLW